MTRETKIAKKQEEKKKLDNIIIFSLFTLGYNTQKTTCCITWVYIHQKNHIKYNKTKIDFVLNVQ